MRKKKELSKPLIQKEKPEKCENAKCIGKSGSEQKIYECRYAKFSKHSMLDDTPTRLGEGALHCVECKFLKKKE
jgi:hypothetical protein